MSYTMTLDVPQETAAYVGAWPRAQFESELSAIARVIVQPQMQDDKDEKRSVLDFAADLRKFGIQDSELDLPRKNDTLREMPFAKEVA